MNNQYKIEQACIGGMLLDSTAVISTCIDKKITPDYFQNQDHRTLYECMLRYYNSNKVVDALTMQHHFKDHHVLGGHEVYEKAIDIVVTATHSNYYIELLAMLHAKTSVKTIAHELVMLCNDEYKSETELIADVQSKILSLNKHSAIPDKALIAKKIVESYDAARNGKCIGLPSPFPMFDAMTGGPRSGLHTVIAAPRGVGKSTLIVNWSLHLGMKELPAAVLAMEDGAERFWSRMAACYGEYSDWRMSMGGGNTRTTDNEIDKSKKCLDYVTSLPVYVDGKRGMTITEIRSKAVQLKAKYGIDSLWIDGFKDIRRERSDELIEGARISAGLCDIAESLNIKVLSTHHVTKEASKSGDDMELEDIRGTGVILDDARMVILLQPSGLLDCKKNNFGPTGATGINIDLAHCQVTESNSITTAQSIEAKQYTDTENIDEKNVNYPF